MLQRALHGGGEVAAAGGSLGCVARQGSTSASKGGRWGASVRRVEASASQDVAGRALHGAGGGALHSGGENKAKELEEGEKDPNTISEISRDQTVKQR